MPGGLKKRNPAIDGFLLEMPVVRQNVGQSFVAHREHGDAVGQTIAFVHACFVKGDAREKSFMGVRYDHDPWRLERNADIADSLAPEMRTLFGEKI